MDQIVDLEPKTARHGMYPFVALISICLMAYFANPKRATAGSAYGEHKFYPQIFVKHYTYRSRM